MTVFKLVCAVAVVSLAATAPAAAKHKHRHHHRHHGEGSLYIHNYGPPVWPGQPYAYYDGPTSALCKQSAAAYRGQDGRRHPCY
ncbi:hypothetical protein LPW26_16340 [Rhodopseudomonas sp. HC1]|uniref:hypothetical protein n=1 Tax=Rhodopseudomonas infernalis TaxID=2897386 RepID=UPI001EE93BAB|nr:hypothetical protein [Rhodopseudomonas infernalis]MCG6206220.1 hypothetical protein [Rhodopseudomonas infernalis]